MRGTKARTLVDVLRRRAADEPDRSAYVFLDGDGAERSLTYLELDVRARRVAVALAARRLTGRPVLIVCDPGLEFIVALFGCFYAGAVAVPAYPPDPRTMSVGLGRMERIAADAGAAVVLATQAVRDRVAGWLGGAATLRALEWCLVEDVHVGSEMAWVDRGGVAENLAFLQYTSGSTGAPKGVMVTHGNILAHGDSVSAVLGLDATSVVVSWLPLYHDMGLIGTVLIPLQVGCRSIQLSALDFLERPVRWLRAMSRYRGTLSPAPNFAFDLVARKTDEEDRRTLDLSTWVAAMNGAEPVRAETCDRFVAAFASAGFRREALVPCYGLAEATLMVAGGPPGAVPTTLTVDGHALGAGRVHPTTAGGPRARTLVGSGRIVPGLKVAIVDSETSARCDADEVGEIWVAGPHVTAGYWQHAEETAAVFRAEVADEPGEAYLRTGDLGFLRDGMLFVTGRLKDLLIIRGRNLYPHDLEETAGRAHRSLRPGGGAAFAVEVEGDERLVVVHESDAGDAARAAETVDAVRSAIAREHDVTPHAVVLIPPRALPKTSSGKVRRRACREAYERGELVPLHGADGAQASRANVDAAAIEEWLVRIVADLRSLPAERIHRDDVLMALGIDSAEAAEVAVALGDRLGHPVPLRLLFEHPTIASLAARLGEVYP